MGLSMLLEVAPGTEGLDTVFTFIGFFSRVHFPVSSEVRYLSKSLFASFFFANEWFLIVVYSLVLIKGRDLFKSLLTDRTSERSIYFVGPLMLI